MSDANDLFGNVHPGCIRICLAALWPILMLSSKDPPIASLAIKPVYEINETEWYCDDYGWENQLEWYKTLSNSRYYTSNEKKRM